jgi:hypothetical protein
VTLPPGLVRLFSKRTARSSVEYFFNAAIDQETEIIRAELARFVGPQDLSEYSLAPRGAYKGENVWPSTFKSATSKSSR